MWKQGYFDDLLKESSAIQKNLMRRGPRHENREGLGKSFVHLMFEGRTRDAFRLLIPVVSFFLSIQTYSVMVHHVPRGRFSMVNIHHLALYYLNMFYSRPRPARTMILISLYLMHLMVI